MAPVVKKEVEEVPPEVLAARAKLRERMGEGAQVGGKGSMRRKSKPIPKSNHVDDKQVGEVAKKAGLQEITGMEEANIIFNDGAVVQFTQPKLRGLMQANSFVLHGNTVQTSIYKLAPEMRGQGGSSQQQQQPGGGIDVATLQKLQEIMRTNGFTEKDLSDPSKMEQISAAMQAAGFGGDEASAGGMEEVDDDMPALTGNKNFEDVSADAD